MSYCFDCEKLLCHECVNAHEAFQAAAAAFEGHKVTPVKQFQAGDYETLLKRQSFCSQQYHQREVTRFFCLECQTCVCKLCIVSHHKNHSIDPLEKAADDEKANIMSGIESMKEKRKVYTDLLREVEEATCKLEDKIAVAIEEVSQTAKQMMAKIQECKQETIAALQNKLASKTEKLIYINKQVQSSIKQIDQAVEFANNLVQTTSSSDIMQSKKKIVQRFQYLSETPVPALPVSSFVMFVSNVAPESFNLGFLATFEIDVHRSTVQKITENFQAGLEAAFLVCPKISKGELSSETKVEFHAEDVEVLVEPAEQDGSLTISERDDRNFQVKFIPKVPGTYNITVKINGDKLAKSPLTVQVAERQLHIADELDSKGEIPQKPYGIAVNNKGLIAVADNKRNCVLIFNKEGKIVRKLGCYGKNPGEFDSVAGVTFLNDDEILVADELNHRIQQFNVQTGNFVKSFGKKGTREGEFQDPVSVCMDDEGRVVVTEYYNNRIQVLTKDGKSVFKFGDSGSEKLYKPTGCVYHKNMFIVSDCWNHCLKVFDSSGEFLYKIGEKGDADGQFYYPWGLCVEKYGNRQNLLVCDRRNGRVQQFTVEGRFTGKTVTDLQKPTDIATTPDGRILVSEAVLEQIK